MARFGSAFRVGMSCDVADRSEENQKVIIDDYQEPY
jgi:hypothetical protein